MPQPHAHDRRSGRRTVPAPRPKCRMGQTTLLLQASLNPFNPFTLFFLFAIGAVTRSLLGRLIGSLTTGGALGRLALWYRARIDGGGGRGRLRDHLLAEVSPERTRISARPSVERRLVKRFQFRLERRRWLEQRRFEFKRQRRLQRRRRQLRRRRRLGELVVTWPSGASQSTSSNITGARGASSPGACSTTSSRRSRRARPRIADGCASSSKARSTAGHCSAISRRGGARSTSSRICGFGTPRHNGVLIYLLLADRKVEIVADRSIDAKVGAAGWEAICRDMEAAFRNGQSKGGVVNGIRRGVARAREVLSRPMLVRAVSCRTSRS